MPALAAKVLMMLCQSPMQPGFKDRTPQTLKILPMQGIVKLLQLTHTLIFHLPNDFHFSLAVLLNATMYGSKLRVERLLSTQRHSTAPFL